MSKFYYCVPCQNEIGEYISAEGINNFPRGIYLAYANCCLTTGFKTRKAAEKWMKKNPCKERRHEHVHKRQ